MPHGIGAAWGRRAAIGALCCGLLAGAGRVVAQSTFTPVTLACVHAANGRFAEAQAAIDQAVAQLEADTERPGQVRNALLAEFRGHAALFRDGKPHREPARP